MPELPPRAAIAQSPLTLVLPAHDAAAVLEKVVEEWTAVLDRRERDYAILLVDDGSSDGTGDLADRLAANEPRLKVLRHAEQLGFGACLRTALREASHPLLLYAPCDRRYQPQDLGKFLEAIDELDIVSACRDLAPVPRWLRAFAWVLRWLLYVLFGMDPQPAPTWLGGRRRCYAWLVRALFGLRFLDPGSEFKLVRREVFERIPIQSDGRFVHTELAAKANFADAPLDEVLVSYQAPAETPDGATPIPWRELLRVLCRPTFGRPRTDAVA